jgi:hypothetical protein
VFRRLEQRLSETGRFIPTATVNGGRPRNLRTPASEDAIIAAVERMRWRISLNLARELVLSKLSALEVLADDQLHP